MRISARNQIKGTVVEVKKGATTSHVRVDIGGGQIVTSSITNEAVDELGIKAERQGHRRGESLRRHDRGGLIMRASFLIALAAARRRPRLGGGRTERLRQVQMADRARARGADRAGSRQAGLGRRTRGFAVQRHDARLVAPAEAKLPTPPERAPKEGTFAGFASFKTAPKAGLYTISLSAGGWVDVVQDGHFLKPKAFSGATDCDGIRKTMKYELSASPFVLQISGTKENSISIAILPTE